MKRAIAAAAVAGFLAFAGPAFADTLYVAPPAPAAPGHPLRLGPDVKAQQIGDLVSIIFNFNVSQASSSSLQKGKSFNAGLGAGTGIAGISFLRFPSSLGGSSSLNTSDVRANTQTFNSAMMATVTDVLPSGALVVSGVQRVIINNQTQNMRVSGLIRPQDIDASDSVLSTQMANVELKFDGQYQEQNKGLIRRILDWIF